MPGQASSVVLLSFPSSLSKKLDAKAPVEAVAGFRADFLDEGKVVVGRDDGDMPHIDGQQRKLRLNVAAVEIAASEYLDGEGMALMPNSA